MMFNKPSCDGCGVRVRARNLVKEGGKRLCFKCRQRLISYKDMISVSSIGNHCIPVEDALARIYEVGASWQRNGKSLRAYISVPSCLAGKRVKLSLVEEGDI